MDEVKSGLSTGSIRVLVWYDRQENEGLAIAGPLLQSLAGRRLGLRKRNLDKIKVLVVDFGSTFKVGAFDAKSEEFNLHYVPTTPDDIRIRLAKCEERGDWQPLDTAMSNTTSSFPAPALRVA